MIYQPSDVLQRLDQSVGHESAVWIRILSMLIHTTALWDYPLLHTAVCANSHFRLTYSHSGCACTQLAVRIRSSDLLICTAALWIRTLSQLICTDGRIQNTEYRILYCHFDHTCHVSKGTTGNKVHNYIQHIRRLKTSYTCIVQIRTMWLRLFKKNKKMT